MFSSSPFEGVKNTKKNFDVWFVNFKPRVNSTMLVTDIFLGPNNEDEITEIEKEEIKELNGRLVKIKRWQMSNTITLYAMRIRVYVEDCETRKEYRIPFWALIPEEYFESINKYRSYYIKYKENLSKNFAQQIPLNNPPPKPLSLTPEKPEPTPQSQKSRSQRLWAYLVVEPWKSFKTIISSAFLELIDEGRYLIPYLIVGGISIFIGYCITHPEFFFSLLPKIKIK